MPSVNLNDIPKEVNEPSMHGLAQGFIAPSSVAMRVAPEILLLELFRDVFFAGKNTNDPAQELQPEILTESGHLHFSNGERAVINCLRGRRKRTKKTREDIFYAPAYPSIASQAWLGKSRERTVGRLLFEEAFPQWLWCRGSDCQTAKLTQQQAIQKTISALLGTKKKPKGSPDGVEIQDILASAEITPMAPEQVEKAEQALSRATGSDERVFRTEEDPLATRICTDFLALCEAENEMPRMLWLKLLMTFLRFSLPMWFLARLEVTVIVRDVLVDALSGRTLASAQILQDRMCARNLRILEPSLTRSRLLYDRIAKYIRSRVELNILLNCMQQLRPEQLSGKKVVLHQPSSGQIGVVDLLRLAAGAADELRASSDFGEAPSIEVFLTRAGEGFRAWRNPLCHGQGKNIREFMRVLMKAETGDEEGGHLLVKEGRSENDGFRVFPGSLLLQLVSFLAFQSKKSGGCLSGGGTGMTLRDIEVHFKTYGIDFTFAAETRPMLAKELQNLGLLVGSPDAGGSVGVTVPFLS